MKALIVSGGAAPSRELVQQQISKCSLVVCADGGGNCLYKYKIIPEYLVGDFDSINQEALTFFKNSNCGIEKYPQTKNFTDTEIALNKAVELGASEVVFTGCTGYRLDHVLANLGMLLKCNYLNVKACIKDEHNTIELLDMSTIIKGHAGETFSLHAYCDCVKNLSIIGARYKLDNYDLCIGDGRTVSNEFLDKDVSIIFDAGKLILMRSID
ncbi:thiamine diphosphokinase [Clostridium sp. WILCCON 0269]|uniref:Thiamine diphosphokinase n=1 Tax=Candidatus Clostridium eludens TaxID=3381663 RepID=A0ABW8SJK2_9CLOT